MSTVVDLSPSAVFAVESPGDLFNPNLMVDENLGTSGRIAEPASSPDRSSIRIESLAGIPSGTIEAISVRIWWSFDVAAGVLDNDRAQLFWRDDPGDNYVKVFNAYPPVKPAQGPTVVTIPATANLATLEIFVGNVRKTIFDVDVTDP